MLRYILYKNNNKKSVGYGKWYARAVVGDTVNVKALAKRISDRCTVTEPDIVAVISALVTAMNEELIAGRRVLLDGFGSFRATIKTKPAEKPEDFGNGNIVGSKILFYPTVTVGANHKRSTNMLAGLKVGKMDVDPSNAAEA